jgi:beta-barrel assembly-enhancing protease
MEGANILYYASQFLEPEPVVVLVYDRTVHLYEPVTHILKARFPLNSAIYEFSGGTHKLYLDAGKRQHLLIPGGHTFLVTIEKELADARLSFGGRLIKSRLAVFTTILIAVIVGFYFAVLSFVPWLGAKVISKEYEIQIGGQLMDLMMRNEKIDSSATQKLKGFGSLLQLSEEYPIRLTVIEGATVNAFALPGGNIVVYKGLLKKIKSPEELAALLSHESMHVTERHTLKSMLRSVANTIIISVVFGDATGIAGALLGNVDAVTGLSYSRSLESEADEEGMQLLLRNDVDPEGMRELMATLQQEEKKQGMDEGYSFLRTHPLTKDRIRKAEKFLQKNNSTIESRKDLQYAFDQVQLLR